LACNNCICAEKLTELTGRNTAATLVLDVFANDDKIVWRGHLFTHSFALHDDDESLGKQLRVVRGSRTQTRRFYCMVVASVQFIVGTTQSWKERKT
jgi:hypothetical protein